MFTFTFFFTSILLGVGLAMDAFSVSLANGLGEPDMRPRRMCAMAGIFAGFQLLMPLLGWFFVHTLAKLFTAFQPLIPWIALGLLSYIGGKMLYESITDKGEEEESAPTMERAAISALILQGVATSIDALSVGFTISDYSFLEALLCCTLIGAITFGICYGGIEIGKRAGTVLKNKAGILGGSILIFIGIEIFVSSFFK